MLIAEWLCVYMCVRRRGLIFSNEFELLRDLLSVNQM